MLRQASNAIRCERESGEIGNRIEVAIIPSGVSDAKVDTDIPVFRKNAGVLPFAGAGIKNGGARAGARQQSLHRHFRWTDSKCSTYV